jgi:hypothetical protein
MNTRSSVITTTVVLTLAAFTAFAQTATKPAVSTAKPISGYMRRTGLSYLEQIEDFQRECDGLKDTCSAALDRWPRIFEAMEDRITVTLSEPKRSAGDQPFFELLKHAKDSRMYSFTLASLHQDHKPSYSSKKTLDHCCPAKISRGDPNPLKTSTMTYGRSWNDLN